MNWLRKFMTGRYGMDQLSMALLILFVILSFIGQFIRSPWVLIPVYALLVLTYFRIFSRDINKRYQENYRFCQFWNPIRQWFSARFARLRDSKDHKYLKCPSCSATLRVPRKRGKICVTCPKCRTQFNAKS